MRSAIRKLAALSIAASIAGAPLATNANIASQMNQMFDDLGTIGNVTDPGAFRAQTMNLYIGGNLMMRTPGKNYTLANVQMPSLKAGCGGIDLFGGSFSFVNKEQFVALLKNIGANAIGYAFNLALCSISPDICNQLKYLQDQINKINTMNINSCEAAQSLVNGMVGEYDQSKMSGCANISQYLGSVADRSDARYQCASNATAVTDAAAKSADPNVRNGAFTQGNVMWEALKKVAWLTRPEREVLMSISGTYIVYPAPAGDAAGPAFSYRAPTITGLRDILLGHKALGGGKVEVQVLKCNEPDLDLDPEWCMDPKPQPQEVEPFVEKIRKTLVRISDNIRDRKPQTGADIGFINTTSEPVYLLLSVANARADASVAYSYIERYKDVIALDYAETFLAGLTRDVTMAAARSARRTKTESDYVKQLADDVTKARAQILAEKQTAYTHVTNIRAFAEDLRQLQTAMWGSLPVSIKSMLDYAHNPAGGKL